MRSWTITSSWSRSSRQAVSLSHGSDVGTIEVKVPQDISDHCKVGWQINLLLGATRHGWRIVETGNVYPKEL